MHLQALSLEGLNGFSLAPRELFETTRGSKAPGRFRFFHFICMLFSPEGSPMAPRDARGPPEAPRAPRGPRTVVEICGLLESPGFPKAPKDPRQLLKLLAPQGFPKGSPGTLLIYLHLDFSNFLARGPPRTLEGSLAFPLVFSSAEISNCYAPGVPKGPWGSGGSLQGSLALLLVHCHLDLLDFPTTGPPERPQGTTADLLEFA